MSASGWRGGISQSFAGLRGRHDGSCLSVGEGKIKAADGGHARMPVISLSAHCFLDGLATSPQGEPTSALSAIPSAARFSPTSVLSS